MKYLALIMIKLPGAFLFELTIFAEASKRAMPQNAVIIFVI